MAATNTGLLPGFQEAVAKAIEKFGVDDLAIRFDVAASTVKRWAAGIAKPAPRVQQHVIDTLSPLLNT